MPPRGPVSPKGHVLGNRGLCQHIYPDCVDLGLMARLKSGRVRMAGKSVIEKKDVVAESDPGMPGSV
jgi:hypothetical protein